MIEINEINPEKANEYIQSGALFIDVREPDEVNHIAFDLPNIQHIAFSTFDENYMDIPKGENIVIACHLGIRSLRVAQFLVVQGWDVTSIFSLEGGIDAWENARYPVKKAPRSFSFAKPTNTGCCGGSSTNTCC